MRWSRPIQLPSLFLTGLAIVLVAAVLAIACGGEAEENDQEEIRSLVNRFFEGLEEEDWNTAYALMSDGYRAQCRFQWFEREFKAAITQAGPISSWAVAHISVHKEQAQATVTWERSDGRGEGTYFFLKQEGAWLIAPELDPQRGDEEICDW
jgi:hypothetical protein